MSSCRAALWRGCVHLLLLSRWAVVKTPEPPEPPVQNFEFLPVQSKITRDLSTVPLSHIDNVVLCWTWGLIF